MSASVWGQEARARHGDQLIINSEVIGDGDPEEAAVSKRGVKTVYDNSEVRMHTHIIEVLKVEVDIILADG